MPDTFPSSGPGLVHPVKLSPQQRRRQRLKLIALFLVCASPVLASYLAYYVFPPEGRTHYGALVEPQRPVPALALAAADGAPADASLSPAGLQSLRGRWVLLQVDSGACDTECVEKLYMMRQLRTMTGKERSRIERAWLVTSDERIDERLLEPYEGTWMTRADRAELLAWLPLPEGAELEDFLFLVDPLGNLMMRFERQGDPKRIHKDLTRLLKASRVG